MISTRIVLCEKFNKYKAASIRTIQIEENILDSKELVMKMVGNLYPSIIFDNIDKLKEEKKNLERMFFEDE